MGAWIGERSVGAWGPAVATLMLVCAASAVPALAQSPTVTPAPAALPPLDAYAAAATTTILAEQHCPGMRLDAGRLTNLRLAAKVAKTQEAALEAKLRARAAEMRQRLLIEGEDAWCAAALAAFGPQGSVAKNVLWR